MLGVSKRISPVQRLPQVVAMCWSVVFFTGAIDAYASPLKSQQALTMEKEFTQSDLFPSVELFSYDSYTSGESWLHSRLNRSSLRYESVTLTLSYRLMDILRLSSGGGLLLDREPSHLKPGTVRFGVDLDNPWIFFSDRVESQISTEFKMHEEYEWNSDFSFRAGFHFPASKAMPLPPFTFLAEYFKGYSTHGQMYQSKVDYMGVGLHCKF